MERKDLLSLFVFAFLLAIFFFPIVVLQKTFITTGLIQSDLMNYNYPLKSAYGDALKSGRLLLWSPFIGNGFPVLAEGQTGELYPLNLLLFKFLPNLQAYNYSLLIHYFLAAFFTYLFVRKILKLGQFPGLLSGLIYSLSGFFMTHLVHPAMIQVASFIPMNFFLLEKILQSARGTKNHAPSATRYVLALTVVFALQALAGHNELLYFTVVFLFIYLFIRTLQIHKKQFLPYALRATCYVLLSGFLALGLSAVQILPTLELVQHSTRKTGLSFQESTFYLFPFSHLLTFIKPWDFDFTLMLDYTLRLPDAVNLWETYGYGGIIPLILAGVTIAVWIYNLIKKRPKLKFGNLAIWQFGNFILLLILSLLLALGRSTPLFKLFWLTFPGIKFFKYPTRFLVFTEFSLAILAAIGLEKLERNFFSKKTSHLILCPLTSTLLILVFLDLFITNRPLNPTCDPKTWFQPPPLLSFLKQNLKDNRLHTLRTTLFEYSLIEDLQAQFDLKNLFPANFNLLYGVRQTDVLAGLLLSRYTQLNHQVPNSRLGFEKETLIPPTAWIRIISLQSTKFLLSPIPFYHPNLKLIKTVPFSKNPLEYNIYLLTKDEQKHEKISLNNIYIYENTQSLPRALIVPKAFIIAENEKGILNLLSTADINFREKVLLEERPETTYNREPERNSVHGPEPNPVLVQGSQLPPEADSPLAGTTDNSQSKAEIIKEDNERILLTTQSPKGGFLVLLDTFYPGWKALIDGKPTKIYRANFAFRAIALPEGEHQIEFVYQPLSLRIGGVISLMTGVLTILFLVLRKRIKIGVKPYSINPKF